MAFIQPILAFNIRNAHSELKRLNEILFRQLLSSYGEKLYTLFDDKCRELIQVLLGTGVQPQSCPLQSLVTSNSIPSQNQFATQTVVPIPPQVIN